MTEQLARIKATIVHECEKSIEDDWEKAAVEFALTDGTVLTSSLYLRGVEDHDVRFFKCNRGCKRALLELYEETEKSGAPVLGGSLVLRRGRDFELELSYDRSLEKSLGEDAVVAAVAKHFPGKGIARERPTF